MNVFKNITIHIYTQNTNTMSKKYYITPILVIVESPAKCQKIQQYLGNGYKVIASYGHLRELSSLKDIHLENNKLQLNFNVINNTIKKKTGCIY